MAPQSSTVKTSFQPLADIELFDDDDCTIGKIDNNTIDTINRTSKQNNKSKGKGSEKRNKTLKIFRANITSLSQHAVAYLFKHYSSFHIWSLLETRVTAANSATQSDYFEKRARKFIASHAIPSEDGGMAHGGELISPMHHLNISPIDNSVLLYINAQTGSPLRICATYIRLEKLTFLFANAYFWDKIGPKHPDNDIIFMQLFLLQSIIGLRMFVYADFNCTPEELIETDWHRKLNLQFLVPQGPTTKRSDRKIDFALLHPDLFPIFSAFGFDHEVPWGPHYGLLIEVDDAPLLVKGLVLCCPRDLPMADFNKGWKQLTQYQQYKKYTAANKFASNKLNKQKSKTGIAILGKPSKSLLQDDKYGGNFMLDSIAVGEDLALVALTSEILVMLVCKIESKEWHHYIGRSQYPKFKRRPANRANKADDYYSCHDLLFWGKLKFFLPIQFKPKSRKELIMLPLSETNL